jgi:outer membrane murein-binding lipoprotein Lpp
MLAAVVLAGALAAGCQTKPVSQWVPVPLPVERAPSTRLTVVGVGETADEAREQAIAHMVHQVILPPSEPAEAPTARFVDSLIRGYDVASVTRDFLGRYYVTVELTISQLGINYQELYSKCSIMEDELKALREDIRTEERLSELAEQRAESRASGLRREQEILRRQVLELQAQRQAAEERLGELQAQRLKDEQQIHALQRRVEALEERLKAAGVEVPAER